MLHRKSNKSTARSQDCSTRRHGLATANVSVFAALSRLFRSRKFFRVLVVVVVLALIAGMGFLAEDYVSQIDQAIADKTVHAKNQMPPVDFAVTRSVQSGRRFIASVVTLEDGPSDRLDNFLTTWHDFWPELKFNVQLSVRNSRQLRGYGLFTAHTLILANALKSQKSFDYLLVFEDDAVPFNSTRWPCEMRNDLDQQLDAAEKIGASGILLGAHHVRGFSASAAEKALPNGVVHAMDAWGSFAMMFPRHSLPLMLESFRETIAQKSDGKIASDNAFWLSWQRPSHDGAGGFISTPLLVDHKRGFSTTWGKVVTRKWEGIREWWTIPFELDNTQPKQ